MAEYPGLPNFGYGLRLTPQDVGLLLGELGVSNPYSKMSKAELEQVRQATQASKDQSYNEALKTALVEERLAFDKQQGQKSLEQQGKYYDILGRNQLAEWLTFMTPEQRNAVVEQILAANNIKLGQPGGVQGGGQGGGTVDKERLAALLDDQQRQEGYQNIVTDAFYASMYDKLKELGLGAMYGSDQLLQNPSSLLQGIGNAFKPQAGPKQVLREPPKPKQTSQKARMPSFGAEAGGVMPGMAMPNFAGTLPTADIATAAKALADMTLGLGKAGNAARGMTTVPQTEQAMPGLPVSGFNPNPQVPMPPLSPEAMQQLLDDIMKSSTNRAVITSPTTVYPTGTPSYQRRLF